MARNADWSWDETYMAFVLYQVLAPKDQDDKNGDVKALAAAGFDRTTMQVSFDLSKTGLVADSILVSVRYGPECLIGQIVTADRSVVTTREPALTESRTVCLIGNTRAIDW